ncbi:alpha-E domain-containing protein, partial [Bacillus sp. S34]|nr:alpha-E domain-containing protein [Bacillus sp. S34]
VVGAADPANDPDRASTIDSLALDRHEAASIASAVAVARDHARRAREVVSTELCDCLNVTRSRMPRKVAPDRARGNQTIADAVAVRGFDTADGLARLQL